MASPTVTPAAQATAVKPATAAGENEEVAIAAEMGDVADVTNSTAFLSIDALLDEGRLVEARATRLKQKFKELHDRVLQIYNNDNFLLKRARQSRKELEGEKSKVEKCGEVARTDDGSIQQLKKELAAVEHELNVAQEKESMLQVEALELDRKKQNLTHEVEDAIAAEERRLKPQIEKLHGEIKELGESIERTAVEFDQLKDRREGILAKEKSIKDDMAVQEAVLYEAKLEFTRIEREPERAKRQADIVVKAATTATKELTGLQEKLQAQSTYLHDLEERKQLLDQQLRDLVGTIQMNKDEIDNKMKTYESFVSNLEVDRENHAQLQQRVSELEGLLKAGALALNTERDNLNRAVREKDDGLKEYKQIDQAKADINSEREILSKQREIYVREQHHLDTIRRECAQTLEDLKRDVDILINNFLKEEIAEQRCVSDKEAIQAVIKGLEEQVTDLSLKEQADRRTASNLSIKREQMSREYSRNVGRVMLVMGELKVKQVVAEELQKRAEELKARLEAHQEEYTQIKREKSAKSGAIQSAQQTMSEHQEKTKIYENELEVLRRESLIKDQELSKKRRESHEMRQSCKNLRVEKNKAKKKLDAAADTERDLKQQMNKLNSIITMTEDAMLELKKSYEDAVEERNYTGIQLVDRNDELCILYEKANIQEDILKSGTVMLNQRCEEIRQAAIELADVQREIDLCQRVLPQVRDMEEDLASMLQDLQDERWRAEVLERDLTDPHNAARWRKLDHVSKRPKPGASSSNAGGGMSAGGGGSDDAANRKDSAAPSEDLVALSKKQQELEHRVLAMNEKLMEKDLILEEVTALSNKLRKQAMSGREFTLALAKKVNSYQFGIKSKTKKMMATLSELSMVQASSIQLGQQLQRVQEEVSEARERTEQGEAPTETVLRQMDRDEREAQRRAELTQSKKEKVTRDENALQLRTTAEQRPNAYVPDTDLGLPKPYGAHAPFKPTLAAQHNVSRFYHKVQQQELNFDA